jgi:stringent starvation protein B
MDMTSTRPYLLRAFHEWIVDNDCTPHIIVDATHAGVEVPRQFIKDGQIVLNIHPRSVAAMVINNQAVDFNARFGGVAMHVHVPMAAIRCIYVKENGRAFPFESEPEAPEPPPASSPINQTVTRLPRSKPSLKVVK